jgi:hypothetical protein
MVQGLKRQKTFASGGKMQIADGDEIDMDDDSGQDSDIQEDNSHQNANSLL